MKAPCDRPAEHPGRHHSGQVAHNASGSRIAIERMARPEHPYAWTHREHNWRRRLIECVPGCSANDGFLCRAHYNATWEKQEGRCAICGALFFRGVKPYPNADHHHRDPDGRGPFRGILCGGKTRCNFRLGLFERRRIKTLDDWAAACLAYLASPPASLKDSGQ